MKDKELIAGKEIGYWCRKFKCQPDAIRLAKMVVGDSANSIEEYVQELRQNAVDDIVKPSIPFDKLFKEGV